MIAAGSKVVAGGNEDKLLGSSDFRVKIYLIKPPSI